MESKELTLVAGGAAVALVVGLGAASWALMPVGRALKAAPAREAAGPQPLSATASQPLAQSPPIEVASLASTSRPADAPATAPLAAAEPGPAPAAEEAGQDAADSGPRTVHALPDGWSSPYERRRIDEAPRPYETWRHYQAREPADDAENGPPPPGSGPSYPDDPQ
jgi:hypothetical protein